MKKSEIVFSVELDENNIPEKIHWNATDRPDEGLSQTNAISLSMWDHFNKNTMRIDLWTKQMAMDEMKRFYIDSIGGLAQSLLTATGDEYMANEMEGLCNRLVKHVEEEMKKMAEDQGPKKG